jgi:RNA polymerase sigma-70 factor (ECF subfamily)
LYYNRFIFTSQLNYGTFTIRTCLIIMKEEKIITAETQIAEDAEHVRAFQEGKEDAFNLLLLRHKDRVFNICFRFLGDYQEADDTAQEVWVKIYRYLHGFKLESQFTTWLYRITVNAISASYTFNKKTISLNNPNNKDTHASLQDIKDSHLSPLGEIESKEKLTLIQQAINSLSEEHKTVVILRDIEGLSYDEILLVTGYKPGTMKSRLARARLELKKKLKGIL